MTLARKQGLETQREELGQAQYKVLGDASSQLLMRIFGLLAQQDLLPEYATVRKNEDVLVVRMNKTLISRRRADLIAEKMRSLVQTHLVEFSWTSSSEEIPVL